MGANTLITALGQTRRRQHLQQVSVGSVIDAFGVLTSQSSGNATLDASAGHVRLDLHPASGLVTVQGSGTLTLNLVRARRRPVGAIAPFDFTGSGASPTPVRGRTGTLDLTNSTAGVPVIVTGQTSSFPARRRRISPRRPCSIRPPSTRYWSSTGAPGRPRRSPFTTAPRSTSISPTAASERGIEIQVGAQLIDIVGLSVGSHDRSQYQTHVEHGVHHRPFRQFDHREFQYLRGIHHPAAVGAERHSATGMTARAVHRRRALLSATSITVF